MPGKAFLDTNVLIYAVTQSDARAARAEELLIAGGVVSVQILNEFTAVARRKLQMPWAEVAEAVEAFLVLCPSPIPVTWKYTKRHERSRRSWDAIFMTRWWLRRRWMPDARRSTRKISGWAADRGEGYGAESLREAVTLIGRAEAACAASRPPQKAAATFQETSIRR